MESSGATKPSVSTLDSIESKVEETKKYLVNNVSPGLVQSKEKVTDFFSSSFSRFSTNLSYVTPESVKKLVGVQDATFGEENEYDNEPPKMDEKQLNEALKQFKKDREQLEREKAEFSIHRGSKDDIISLNIGGTKFSTLRENFAKVKGSNLDLDMLSIKKPLRDRKGRFFIDRDPTYFPYVMNYLRGEKTSPLSDLERARVAEEFEFYGISVQLQQKK